MLSDILAAVDAPAALEAVMLYVPTAEAKGVPEITQRLGEITSPDGKAGLASHDVIIAPFEFNVVGVMVMELPTLPVAGVTPI